MKNKFSRCFLLFAVMSLSACGNASKENDKPKENKVEEPTDTSGFSNITDGPFEIHTDLQKSFLSYTGNYETCPADLYPDGKSHLSDSLPVTLTFDYDVEEGKEISKYSVVFGQKEDLSDGYKVDGGTVKAVTFYNPFLGTFTLQEGVFTVDYSALRLSTGPLEEAVYEAPEWTADNVLTVKLGRSVGRWNDYVRLYVHCPEMKVGILTAPVYRNDKKISVMLSSMFLGREVHVYGLVSNDEGLWAETTYVGRLVCDETAVASGQCSVASGQCSVVSEQCSVASGQEDRAIMLSDSALSESQGGDTEVPPGGPPRSTSVSFL